MVPIPNREGLPAGVTFAQAWTADLAGQAADSLVVMIAAMRADRAFGQRCAST